MSARYLCASGLDIVPRVKQSCLNADEIRSCARGSTLYSSNKRSASPSLSLPLSPSASNLSPRVYIGSTTLHFRDASWGWLYVFTRLPCVWRGSGSFRAHLPSSSSLPLVGFMQPSALRHFYRRQGVSVMPAINKRVERRTPSSPLSC